MAVSREVLIETIRDLLSAAKDASNWIAEGEQGNLGDNSESWFSAVPSFDAAVKRAERLEERLKRSGEWKDR